MAVRALLWSLLLAAAPVKAEPPLPPLPPLTPAQEARLAPVARLAPTSPKAPLLLKGKAGREAGTPELVVNRPALRSLLLRGRFEELTRQLEGFQQAFEAEPAKEAWLTAAAETLGTGEPDLEPLLDAWVASAGDSFAPWLARGAWWVASGWGRRGYATSDETPPEDFAAMHAALGRARRDLRAALAARPRLVVAHALLIRAAMLAGDDAEGERAFAAAAASCPSCLQPRLARMMDLEPRWGGSLERMSEFAEGQAALGVPRFALLRGYPGLARLAELERAEAWEEAFRLADEVVAAGEHCEFYQRRARILLWRRIQDAWPDLKRALELCADEPAVAVTAGRVLQLQRRWSPAATWLRTGLLSAPNDPRARRFLPGVLQGLRGEASRLAGAGEPVQALEAIDLVLELAPEDAAAQAVRDTLLQGRGSAEAATIEALERRHAGNPKDLDALRRLSTALTRGGSADRAEALWTAQLERNPDSGRSHLERARLRDSLGRRDEARADAAQACELGLAEGCALARRLAPPGTAR